jgi:hypothetical protein
MFFAGVWRNGRTNLSGIAVQQVFDIRLCYVGAIVDDDQFSCTTGQNDGLVKYLTGPAG